MLTVAEVVMLVSVFIVPLQTPKKKLKRIADTDTINAHYAVNEYGYIVKL